MPISIRRCLKPQLKLKANFDNLDLCRSYDIYLTLMQKILMNFI